MGKLSISVPADLERQLRRRAKEENTTISALLTEAARRDFDSARHITAIQRLLEESIAEQGPITAREKAEIASFMTEVDAFRESSRRERAA